MKAWIEALVTKVVTVMVDRAIDARLVKLEGKVVELAQRFTFLNERDTVTQEKLALIDSELSQLLKAMLDSDRRIENANVRAKETARAETRGYLSRFGGVDGGMGLGAGNPNLAMEMDAMKRALQQMADTVSLQNLRINTLANPGKFAVDEHGGIVKRGTGQPVQVADIIPGLGVKNVFTGEGYESEEAWEADAAAIREVAQRSGEAFERTKLDQAGIHRLDELLPRGDGGADASGDGPENDKDSRPTDLP